jgi:hypothetical protein
MEERPSGKALQGIPNSPAAQAGIGADRGYAVGAEHSPAKPPDVLMWELTDASFTRRKTSVDVWGLYPDLPKERWVLAGGPSAG